MGYEIDFLQVGEKEKCGDAIALRFGNLYGNKYEQTVVVIDGGFKENGENLVNHINNYYNTDTVNLVVSTHPDSDHSSGLEVVLDELEVHCLWLHRPWNHTDDISRMFQDGRVTDNSVREKLRRSLENARSLEQIAYRKGIPILEPFTGLSDNSNKINVVGPTESYYESLLPNFRGTQNPKQESIFGSFYKSAQEIIHKIAESWNIETLDDSGDVTAENSSSVILLINIEGDYLFFTGDAGIEALTNAVDILEQNKLDLTKISFIQIPHHGSKRNVGPTLLNRMIGNKIEEKKKFRTAFVSVPTNGEPKHPSKKVTNAFLRRGAFVYKTNNNTIWQHRNAPDREGWTSINELPLYDEVED